MTRITITWHNANADTIWGKLAAKLGREPTNVEAATEVRRILSAASDERLIRLASEGKLPHQRGRAS